MKKNKIISLLLVFTLLNCSLMYATPVMAKDSIVTSPPYYSDPTPGNTQHRFITITKDPAWTSYKYVSGQPTKGTYLEAGDGLYYGESGGSKVSISFAIEYAGCVSVGFSVPIGKMSNSYYGKFLKAKSKGFYKIKARKEIKPTIKLIQYRYRKNGKWGSWGKAKVYSKKYTVVRSQSVLQKIS